MNPDYVFLSTIAVSSDARSPVWEIAAHRVNPVHGRRTDRLYLQVKTDKSVFPDGRFPENYDQSIAVDHACAALKIERFMRDTPVLASSDPYIEADRLTRQLLEPSNIAAPWNPVMLGLDSLMAGYLSARIGGYGYFPDPQIISMNLGVWHGNYATHTAEGRVKFALAQWARVTHRSKE